MNPRMTELCNRFHSLRGAPGTDPWQQKKFARWASGGITAAERQAAAFVLTVWNGHHPDDGGWWNEPPFRVGRFDVVVALAHWDYQHRAAFIFWCQHPFWP